MKIIEEIHKIFKTKMDKIDVTGQEYKKTFLTSASILLVLVQIYPILLSFKIDLFNFEMVNNPILRTLFQVFINSFLFLIVYLLVKQVHCYRWIKHHKDIWIQGDWLHIHVKKDIRIGLVEIRQDFYSIKAQGHNISPKDTNRTQPERETTWNYVLGSVMNDTTPRDFIGCYTAHEVQSQTKKDGVHILTIEPPSKNDYPTRMIGCFRDTCKIDKRGITDVVGNHAGELYLFKLSPSLKEYLFSENGCRYDLLAELHKQIKFREEPFVIKLLQCLPKE